MADHKKALTHHGHAGKALRAGDAKAAAHHLGHAMSALRSSALPGLGVQPKRAIPPTAPVQEGGEPDEPIQPKPNGLRGRLSQFRRP